MARRSQRRSRRTERAAEQRYLQRRHRVQEIQRRFPGLLGADAELSAEDLQAFTDFILQVTYPPNPIRSLDNQLTPFEQAGKAFFNAQLPNGQEIPSDVFHNCNTCHVVDPDGNRAAGAAKPGFFGSDGRFSFESETQYLKVPHLRNMYQKVGMFGMADTFPNFAPLPNPASPVPLLAFLPAPLNDTSHQGDQVRGVGFLHDGSVDTLFRFHGANVFTQRPLDNPFPNPGGITADGPGVLLRRQIEAFVMAMDSNLAPIVGQQVTLTVENASDAAIGARVDLLKARAAAGECDLVVRGRREVKNRGRGKEIDVGYLYQPASGRYQMSIAGAAPLTESELRPAGGGQRLRRRRRYDHLHGGAPGQRRAHRARSRPRRPLRRRRDLGRKRSGRPEPLRRPSLSALGWAANQVAAQ